MKCDICSTDNGEGIHYHAFIDGKHHWVCESCKTKLKKIIARYIKIPV